MVAGQGPYFAGSSSGVSAVPSSHVIWTVTAPALGTPFGSKNSQVPTEPLCIKHRLGNLELIGDEVEGTCLGCGARVVVPALPEAGKTMLRALQFEDRVMALRALPEPDRRRAMLNMLVDYMDLRALVDGCRSDLAGAERVLRLIGAQLAEVTRPEECEE